jgi:hypothetical protein
MRLRFNIHPGFPIIGHLFYATWGLTLCSLCPLWLNIPAVNGIDKRHHPIPGKSAANSITFPPSEIPLRTDRLCA